MSWAGAATALPPGRYWTPVTRLSIPGYAFAVAPRLELDATGSPQLITLTVFPSDVFAFDWGDSAWVQRWRFGRGTITLWPVQSPPGTHHLVWRGVAPVGDERLFMAQVLEGGIQEPDTVANVAFVSTEYSGAVSSKRRWVAVGDHIGIQRKLRVLYSDAPATWHDAPIARSFGSLGGVALATVGDTSALVAWAETFRLHWATLEGTRWTEGPPFPDLFAIRMQFRRRPSGGQWLALADAGPHVSLLSYHDGVWSPPETLRCAYRDGRPDHSTESPDLSRDDGEYPVIVWDAQNIRANHTICVCVPADSGYGVAEELEGVEGNEGLPTVARDRNGDVWVAWYVVGDDVRWIHSYARATASPRIEGAGRHRRVAWTLSEPAPETWWAVLRARGLDDFEEVARVRAGPGLEMSWTDTSPPAGLLRYKIRRESVDTRYLWESAEVRLPQKSRGLIVRLVGRLPIAQRVALELENAAPGPIELRLFDVQGRMVHQQQGLARGTGQDTIAFDLSDAGTQVPNGMYFASVRDASGQLSQTVRLVVLR